jgi:protein involved in polysaccharide export with SLBB domain
VRIDQPDPERQTMNQNLLRIFSELNARFVYPALLPVLLVTATTITGQTTTRQGNNNPYSPSPDVKLQTPERPVSNDNPSAGEVVFLMQNRPSPTRDESPTIAQQTLRIAKNADRRAVPPIEIYKVGVGDILFVTLKDATGGSGYYTVRSDGTIDYPLAGENVVVADQTVEDIESTLATGISLFSNPQVEVVVREYASHKITISGMAETTGDVFLRREAMPLFVIRAEAGVSSKATTAIINRSATMKIDSYDLSDPNAANALVYPGDAVEFAGAATALETYFVAGEVMSAGQKPFVTGLTLYQAVIASGGAKGNAKKAIIRRKNDKGLFSSVQYNLGDIVGGKAVDPNLSPGDIVEIQD